MEKEDIIIEQLQQMNKKLNELESMYYTLNDIGDTLASMVAMKLVEDLKTDDAKAIALHVERMKEQFKLVRHLIQHTGVETFDCKYCEQEMEFEKENK